MGVIAPQTKFTREFLISRTATLVSGVIAVTIAEMTTITGAFGVVNAAAPPGTATSALGFTWSGNVVTIEGYMPTTTTDTTLIDSTGTETISFFVTGY